MNNFLPHLEVSVTPLRIQLQDLWHSAESQPLRHVSINPLSLPLLPTRRVEMALPGATHPGSETWGSNNLHHQA